MHAVFAEIAGNVDAESVKWRRFIASMLRKKEKSAEDSISSLTNPNLQLRLLAHPDRLLGLKTGKLKAPVMVDIDPVDGVCNLDCKWCCQASSRASRPMRLMSKPTMERLGSFCRDWGVKSWRIAGDSEPLLNKRINDLISSGAESGIDMGLITNGVFLERLTMESVDKLNWLGVSLDAGTRETWSRLKRSPSRNFDKIVRNIKNIRKEKPKLDLSIKFLRWSSVEHLSKEDFKQANLPTLDSEPLEFDNASDVEPLLQLAHELGVRPIIKDAYPKDFADHYRFTRCHATPLGGVFDASHNFHLCCDARGVYVLTDDYTRDDWQEIPRLWGGKQHRELMAMIQPAKCVGCAKYQMNEVLESYAISAASEKQLNFL